MRVNNESIEQKGYRVELLYKIMLSVHLLCAMLFIGWGFAKLFVIAPTKSTFGSDNFANLQKELSKKVWKIYPANMMVLILTGTFLSTQYLTFENGIFPSTFQTMLILKALLAYGIGVKVVLSITKRLFFKMKNAQDPNPVESSAYYYIFTLGIAIVLLAKWMFLV